MIRILFHKFSWFKWKTSKNYLIKNSIDTKDKKNLSYMIYDINISNFQSFCFHDPKIYYKKKINDNIKFDKMNMI